MSGLKQSQILDLPMRDLIDVFRRCDEFATLLRLTRSSCGKYGRTERLIVDARALEDEFARLRVKAAGVPAAAPTEEEGQRDG